MALRRFGFVGLAAWVAGGALLIPGSLKAAPQVLALLTTGGPVSMRCDAQNCRVELPTLCLQPERRAPQPGRGYRLADGQAVVLSGRRADGSAVSIPMQRKIRFTARRTHVTVEATVARHTLAESGIIEPAVTVAQAVSLIPVATTTDTVPLTPWEVVEATDRRRAVAVALVDRDKERMPAVRLTNRLINALPVDEKARGSLRRDLWTRLATEARRRGIRLSALERARFTVSFCAEAADAGRSPSLKRCLQGHNDDTMEYLNTDLETVLKTGS